MNVIKIIAIYLLFVNAGGFLAFLIDKKRSIRSKWRIPEVTLFSFAILGGSIGCLIGMYTFRHKTLHRRFTVGIPAILILEVIAVIALVFISPISFMIQ